MSAITEAAAKTKWCPFVQVAAASLDTHAFTNREIAIGDLPQGEASRCIGSACMAWRELHPRETREDHSGAGAFMAKIACDIRRTVRREGGPGSLGHLIIDATGFCGLAGKP